MISEILVPSLTFTPLVMFACAVAMVVLRAGASRVFFDIVGVFQANRMIKDAEGSATVLEAIYLDAFTSIQESATEIADIFGEVVEATVPIAREIEEARIQFDKFLAEAERSPEVFESISEIGLRYGFAADEAYEASARMAQLAGTLGQGTTPLGTEIGMQFGLISGMETEEAMQRLINLQQQTKFMTQGTENAANQQERLNIMRSNSIRVLDELNTVENRSAATMQQITYVMNQFASQAHLTGESIAAMAAMSATLIEAGEEQGKGGRALRMIYARLGADTNGARTTIEKLGISVIDTETGAMRPFSDILEELAARYQTLEGAEQQQLAQAVAGNRHYTRLIKLLENVDRVRELEEEALTGMFPAMEEIERRRDTELFQLEQAEKKLRNYQAAFGETMIDDMKAGVDLQIVFYDTLTQASDNRALGILLDFFSQTSILMKVAMGPMSNFMLSIFNMGIAIQTLTAIQEAAKAATTSGTAAYTNQYGQLQESIHLYGLYSNALHEVNKEHTLNTLFRETQDIPTTREAQAEVRKEILALMEKRDALREEKQVLEELQSKRAGEALATEERTINLQEEVNALQAVAEEKRRAAESAKAEQAAARGQMGNQYIVAVRAAKRAKEEEKLATDELSAAEKRLRGQRGANTRALNAEDEATRKVIAVKKQEQDILDKIHEDKRRFGAAEIRLSEEEAQAQELRVKGITQSAKAYNNLSIALSGAGMAMMLFRNNERMQRAGMLLNGVAVALQIVKLIESAKASMIKFAATLNEVVATEAQTAAQIRNNMMQEMGIIAKLQYTLATKLATAASISFAAALTVVTAGGMAILAGLAYLVAGAFKDTASSIDETTAAITNLDNVAKIYEDMTLGQINNELREQEKIIEQTKDATQGLAKEQHDAAVQRKNDLINARDVELAQTDAVKNTIAELDKLTKQSQEAQALYDSESFWTRFFAGDLPTDGEAAVQDAIFALNDWKDANKETAEFVKRTGINTLEELEDFNTRSATMIAGTAEDSANAVADSFSDATEEMQEFNNAREELFFGGSASKLTGNLIRQVQQQGVENLITNTEVVMTNVFNGLTIPEMADQIIEEIEYRGYSLGYKMNA
tara:strand:- start:678 stop:3983 length:3306 start_codon:yes stop_codon:yes gene_type:complete